MFKIIRSTYLSPLFFMAFGGCIVLFVFSFSFSFLFQISQIVLLVFFAITIVDAMVLYSNNTDISCSRKLPNLFSLGDENKVTLQVKNLSGLKLAIELYDEMPYQFQMRNFKINTEMEAGETKELDYYITPRERGAYEFGMVNFFVKTPIGLISRRIKRAENAEIAVYPSIVQMKKYELRSLIKTSYMYGMKKIRRLGHSYEFEKIKNYVEGDDFRSINWKATSRRNSLMVNQYQDERSQQVYALIDKSRAMKMPFNGLSLLDYAINTSLVIANTAMQKHDKAGLLTFAEKIDSKVKADQGPKQLRTILNALYKQEESKREANYELLYLSLKNFVKGRSLIFLYTNFESFNSLERVLPILRKINQLHILVIMFFDNTEIHDFSHKDANNIEDIYEQAIAQKFMAEKYRIVQVLSQYGITSIFSRPEDLSINSINKYLELKAKGMI